MEEWEGRAIKYDNLHDTVALCFTYTIILFFLNRLLVIIK
jgi:hypothetical protein